MIPSINRAHKPLIKPDKDQKAVCDPEYVCMKMVPFMELMWQSIFKRARVHGNKLQTGFGWAKQQISNDNSTDLHEWM